MNNLTWGRFRFSTYTLPPPTSPYLHPTYTLTVRWLWRWWRGIRTAGGDCCPQQFTNDAEKDIYIVYDLGDSQGMLKVLVSDLKSEGWDFAKFGKVKKNTLYVYFITRHGAARLNVDTVYIVKQRLLHFCFNFCFFFVFKPILTEHPWKSHKVEHNIYIVPHGVGWQQ